MKLWCLLLMIQTTAGWIHHLKLQNDDRRHISLTSAFGLLIDGTMSVNLTAFTFEPNNILNKTHSFGFTLGKSRSSSIIFSMENSPECRWYDESKTLQSLYLRFDLEQMKVVVTHAGQDLENITLSAVPRPTYLYHSGLAHGINPDVTLPSPTGPTTSKGQEKVKSQVEGETKVQGDGETKVQSKVETKVQGEGESKVQGEVDKAQGEGKTNVQGEGGTKVLGQEDTKVQGEGETKVQGESKAQGQGDAQTAQSVTKTSTTDAAPKSRRRREAEGKQQAQKSGVTTAVSPPLLRTLDITSYQEGPMTIYQTHFLIHVKQAVEEGLYSLFFHNCAKDRPHARVNLSVSIIQENNGNYLSSDRMPIPAMYFMLSVVFFLLTLMWFSVLRKATEGVYKIHYLMLVVVLFKSLSCLFHGVNLYMIQRSGIHVDAWAILWYIVYLMRGALMFVTILLIGAGWVFIKHVFTDREKKLFLIFIPLQILDNVAWVIMEESEEGNSSHDLWRKIFIGVDLLCCFTILFPVVWSIRHLQEASKTDGKAAMNLVKLKLFRHYYFLIVCYIYFTRIIKYFLAITLPFHYGWMSTLFTEVFLLVFFILIGYKFRPMSDNPYLQVPLDSDDEDIEMDEVLTKTGSTSTVVRVNVGRAEGQTQETAMKQRESSHEYD